MLPQTDSLGVKPHLLVSVSCMFVGVGRPSWQENGSVVYNCFWSSSAQSFSGPSLAGFMTIFYCLSFETPSTLRARSQYYFPQEQGGPVIPQGTGFPFRRLLRLAGLQWRYSNPPPHRLWPASRWSLLYSDGSDLRRGLRPHRKQHAIAVVMTS
jgi:hypothetical protein